MIFSPRLTAPAKGEAKSAAVTARLCPWTVAPRAAARARTPARRLRSRETMVRLLSLLRRSRREVSDQPRVSPGEDNRSWHKKSPGRRPGLHEIGRDQ